MPTAQLVPHASQVEISHFNCSAKTLSLEHTLSSGQMFRWQRGDDGWWRAPIGSSGLIISCRENDGNVSGYVINGNPDAVSDYFQIDVDVEKLSADWRESGACEIANSLILLPGLRVCCQDPLECLISFLCSSAAPVYRIRRMIDGICTELGDTIDLPTGETLRAFPTLERLAATDRSVYDRLGFGYRGGFVRETAKELISRGGYAYLRSLRDGSYAEAKSALVSLPGVGAKIADCICLFSLRKHEAVPLDTHMMRIAKRHIAKDLAEKTLTPAIYDEISLRFRSHFGAYAGWAQQYLFTAELHSTGAWDSAAGTHKPGRKNSHR